MINNKDQKVQAVQGWHDLFLSCPDIADKIFSQMNLEEVLKLTEVCEDWSQAVLHSKKVHDRVSQVSLHKAAVQGWMRVAKFLLDGGDDPNHRLVCDGACYTKNVPHEHCYRCDFCERTADDMALSWTPLHRAVALGRKEMTELLLSYGADTSSKLRLFNGQWTPGIPCKHEVTALQLSRMEHPSRLADGRLADVNCRCSGCVDNRSQWEKSGYQRPHQQRDVEKILVQNCASEAERNIGVPVCERRDFYGSCFAVLVNVDGIMSHVSGVSLPELLWVFRDFPKRMDHPANDVDMGCPVRRFNLD